MSGSPSLRAAFGGQSDLDWLGVVKRSLAERVIQGTKLPGFPPDDIQIRTVGSAGEPALEDAFNFYAFVKRVCAQQGVLLGAATTLLDFGIGWGRIARFFLKDVEPENLYGVDVDAALVQACVDSELPAQVSHVDPRGVLPYRDRMFDLVTAYSVFTHLPEPIQDNWLREISRVLAPNGLFLGTVQSPRTLALFESIDPDDTSQHFWHRRVAARLRKHPKCVSAFAKRGFAYLPSQAERWDAPSETFGNAFISPEYVDRHWSEFFEILEYHDSAAFPSAIVVCRARSEAETPG